MKNEQKLGLFSAIALLLYAVFENVRHALKQRSALCDEVDE